MGVANEPFHEKPHPSPKKVEEHSSDEEGSESDGDETNRDWHMKKKWKPFAPHWENDEAEANILRPAFEQMIRAPEEPLSDLSPLDMHTLRKAMTYMMLHRYDIEARLVELETKSESITKGEWRAMWKQVATESAVEDERAAERIRPTTGSWFSFLSQAHILTLDQMTSKQANEVARIERDKTMRRVYMLFRAEYERGENEKREASEGSHEGVYDNVPIALLRSYLNPNKKHRGSEMFKKIRTQAAAELLRQQSKACSIEMSTRSLMKFFHILQPKGTTSPDATHTKVIRLLDETVKNPDEHLAFLMSTGNFDKISFGLSPTDEIFIELRNRTILAVLGGDHTDANNAETSAAWFTHPQQRSIEVVLELLKEDMVTTSACIISDRAWEQFEARFEVRNEILCLPKADMDYFKNAVREYIITEKMFCEAYKGTFGISPKRQHSVCTAGCDLWFVLDDTFNGAIAKKTFFYNSAKKPTIPADGLGYHMGYAKRRYEITMRDMFFVLYIVFVMLLTFFLQADKGIGPGYYLNFGIDQNVGAQEIGDDTKYWYAQTFYDSDKESEYWDFFKGPLLEALFDADTATKPGALFSDFYSQKLVGGLKLRQFRQSPRHCKGQQQLFDSHTHVCRATGDVRKATDWKPIKANKTLTTDPVPTQCLGSSVMYDTRDPIIIIVDDTQDIYWEAYNAVAHVAAILLSEKYNARVEVYNQSLAPWSAGFITIGTGDMGVGTITPGWFMTAAGANACPECVSVGNPALKNVANAAVFGNQILDNNWVTSGVAAKLISNNVTSLSRVGYDQQTYEQMVLSRAANGDAFMFYDTSPGKLTGSFSSVRLALQDDYSSTTILKGYKLDQETYADVEQTIYYLSLSTDDLNTILSGLNDGNFTSAACNWLTKNPWKWYGWIRRDVNEDMLSKQKMYHPVCYDSWKDRSQDELGYQKSENLVPGILAPDTNYTPKAIYNIDSDGALTDELLFYAPTREQFMEWQEQAEGGNFTAETLWKRAQPWVYRHCAELGSARFLSYPGRMVDPDTQTMALYGCSGYGMILPISMSFNDITREIDILIANNWVDVATRGIMVEFFIHNQNSRLFSRFQYMAEISTTGGWATSLQVHTFRLFQLESLAAPAAFMIAICITILLMFTLIYESIRSFRLAWKSRLVELRAEADQAHGNWCPPITCNTKRGFQLAGLRLVAPWLGLYFSEFWYAFDTVFYGVVIVSWCFRFWFIYLGVTSQNVACVDVFPDQYERVAEVSYSMFQLDGVAILLAYMKFIYYLRSFSEINRIVMTVQRASLLIAYLLVIFVIFMMGFTLSAWVVFGTLVERYRGTGDAFGTLLLMMMGDIDFQLMTEARPGFSLTFFLLFYVVVITILFNLLIGVITTAFNEVYKERFDEEAFIARVTHDPASGAWDAERAFGVRQLVMENATVREVKYYIKKMSFPILRFLNKDTGSYDPDYRLSNPRKFWPAFLYVMQDLDSPDMHLVFRAHTVLKLLSKKYGASLDPSSGNDVKNPSQGVKTYDLTAKPVIDFINESVGPARRPLVDFLLVEIPSRVMGLNKTRAWHMVLNDHIVWMKDVQRWANFDLTEDAEDVNNLCQELEGDVEVLKEEMVEFERKILDRLLTNSGNVQGLRGVLEEVFEWNEADVDESERESDSSSDLGYLPITPRVPQDTPDPADKE
eukprot:TRINITY_DN509_c0_g2_i2.p1 TRINITY_DN509_c0_g2~~TRINITY_DN509_c0_g2_i2.p1  ORF type:complete len:1673 (+),score=294.76 TRINITY_DN509_c0_g2_i2:53-5071(+)